MNIQTEIKPELWKAIVKSYEARVYQSAILDAMHYMTDLIREKANIDGDGHTLVGQALGGDTPLIRINKFQTQSEKNEQRGFAEIIRGLYTAIRNPRSHEQIEDTQSTADALILFINYIVGILNQSKGPFVLVDWVNQVFDPDFVESTRYADLLVADVPPKRYIDTLITLYREKLRGIGAGLEYTSIALTKLIDVNELDGFLAVVSDELKVERSDNVVSAALGMLPAKLWPQIAEGARLRIENKLLRSIDFGEVGISHRVNDENDIIPRPYVKGVLGTWATRIVTHFTLRACLTIIGQGW